MTQFLLAAHLDPRVPVGYQTVDARNVELLAVAASGIFANAEAVVKVAPTDGEMDSVVDAARQEMASGAAFEATGLGILLGQLAEQCDFALYWAGEYEGLPSVSTMSEVGELLTAQILSKAGNWELCARFVRTRESGGRSRSAS